MVERKKRIFLNSKGIKNIRNNCFFNSSIQCLLSFGEIIEFYKEDVFNSNQPMSKEFSKFINEYDSSIIVNPELFLNFLHKKIDLFNGTHQDAHEFLIRFLEILHDELSNKFTLCRDLNEFINHTNENIISNLFDSFLKQTVLCPGCKNKSETFVSTTIITGEVNSNAQKIISDFLDKENVDGGESWKCAKCNFNKFVIKNYEVIAYPKILILFIKRYNTRFYKNSDNVEIDEKVKFGNNFYYLNGIVCHSGDLNCGHYFSSSKRNNKWVSYNDSSISSGLKNYSNDQPCIIFYTKNK